MKKGLVFFLAIIAFRISQAQTVQATTSNLEIIEKIYFHDALVTYKSGKELKGFVQNSFVHVNKMYFAKTLPEGKMRSADYEMIQAKDIDSVAFIFSDTTIVYKGMRLNANYGHQFLQEFYLGKNIHAYIRPQRGAIGIGEENSFILIKKPSNKIRNVLQTEYPQAVDYTKMKLKKSFKSCPELIQKINTNEIAYNTPDGIMEIVKFFDNSCPSN